MAWFIIPNGKPLFRMSLIRLIRDWLGTLGAPLWGASDSPTLAVPLSPCSAMNRRTASTSRFCPRSRAICWKLTGGAPGLMNCPIRGSNGGPVGLFLIRAMFSFSRRALKNLGSIFCGPTPGGSCCCCPRISAICCSIRGSMFLGSTPGGSCCCCARSSASRCSIRGSMTRLGSICSKNLGSMG